MPSVLFRLDGQFFWPMFPKDGDPFFGGLSAIGVLRDVIFVDVDFTLHGDPLWRHPLLTPTPLRHCPQESQALDSWPELRTTWAEYFPTYLKLNSTYGFGQADALLSFLFDELLPYL